MRRSLTRSLALGGAGVLMALTGAVSAAAAPSATGGAPAAAPVLTEPDAAAKAAKEAKAAKTAAANGAGRAAAPERDPGVHPDHGGEELKVTVAEAAADGT